MNAADPIFAARAREVIPLTSGSAGAMIDADPRADMGEGALIEASRLAYPVVGARGSRKDGFGLAAGGATALLLGAVTFWSLSGGRESAPEPAPQPVVADSALPASQPLPAGTFDAGGAIDPAASQGSLVFTSSPQPLALGGAPAQVGAGSQPSPMAERLRSPSLIFDQSGPVMPVSAPGSVASAAPAPGGAEGDADTFAARADASASETADATRMADPARTVSQGTMIPAVLETAINSDLPGYVRAVVSQDVRSFDGSRVLIPRSSRLIGQYRSGLSAGQTRAYVLWSRLIRPDGVSVAIASPATDEAGRTGLAGEVDGHFFKRFGSALLLSVLGAASAVGTGGASVILSGGGASAVAAQQNGAIPPTVRVRQGQPIRIFTARDLNFATVAEAPVR